MIDKTFDTPLTALLFLFCLLSAIFLRFSDLETIFTESDDIGIICMHKAQPAKVKHHDILNIGPVKLKVESDGDWLKENVLGTPFFPLQIAWVWTYPIGQYCIYPIILKESDPYHKKLFWGRAISAVMSTLGLVFFIYFMFLLNGKLNASALLPFALLCFSYNHVLYSHHMGPYALSSTCMVFVLITIALLIQDRISLLKLTLSLATLSYFNYLTILCLPLIAIIWIILHKNNLKQHYKNVLLCITSYIVLTAPLYLFFFKPGSGMRGDAPPDSGFFQICYYSILQFSKAAGSTLASFNSNQTFNSTLALIITAIIISLMVKRNSLNKSQRYSAVFGLGFIFIWIILHTQKKITMTDSRHVLCWLPILCTWLFLILSKLNTKKTQLFYTLLFLTICIIGVKNNVEILKSKQSNFDYNNIDSQNISTLICYDNSLDPLAYYANSTYMKVYDLNTLAINEIELELPNEILVVSQHTSLNGFKDEFKIFDYLSSYPNRTIIKEVFDESTFTYNNSDTACYRNGFYLYRFSK